MKATDLIQQTVDWFIPAEQRADEFVLRRARIVVALSLTLAVWGPPLAVVYFLTPGLHWNALVCLVATVLVAHVPFTLRYTRSIVVAGNCLTCDAFLGVSYLSYLAGGPGAPPLVWDVALPMFAVAIMGYRYGLLWTAITLLSFAGFYIYGQLGYSMTQKLTPSQLKSLDFASLWGLLLLILSMTLLYESNQNRSFRLLKASNDKLADTSAHLQAVVDNAPDGILTFDTTGIIRSFNPAAEKLFGYAAMEVLGERLSKLMPLPSIGRGDKYLGNHHQKAEAGIAPHTGRRKSGQWFPMQVAVGTACVGGKQLFTCIVTDVTELAIAEQQQQQFATMVEHGGDFIAMVSLDQRVLYLNPAGRRLVGIGREAPVSDGKLQDYFTERTWGVVKDFAMRVVMDAGSWQGEAQLRHVASGTSIDVHLNILFLRNPRGQDTLWVEAVPSERKVPLAPALSCIA